MNEKKDEKEIIEIQKQLDQELNINVEHDKIKKKKEQVNKYLKILISYQNAFKTKIN